jgi:hypothetical protein
VQPYRYCFCVNSLRSFARRTSQRNTSIWRFARPSSFVLSELYVASTSSSRTSIAWSARRCPKMNRWLFGKLSIRSSSHLVVSYHFTRTTGGSLPRSCLRFSLLKKTSILAALGWESVESRCGAVVRRRRTPFPHPAHQTGHADFQHPAFGQGLMRSHTRGHACAPPSSPNQPARRTRQASADRRSYELCVSDAATDGADTERAGRSVGTPDPRRPY